MKINIVFPWRPQPDRLYSFEWVTNWYKTNFPLWEQLYVDSPYEQWCASAARNIGVYESKDCDAIVISDADTFPEVKPLSNAVKWVVENNKTALPYTQYYSLALEGTQKLLKGLSPSKCGGIYIPGATSGVYVTTYEAWFRSGGQDERFLGWGGEDPAWRNAVNTIDSVKELEGSVYAMHHDGAFKDGFQYTANFALCYRYNQAEYKLEEMKALLSEPGRFGRDYT